MWRSSDFSLVVGGPLFQLLRKAGLAGDGLQLLRRRTAFLTLITWGPLALLAALAPASGGLDFWHDLDVHVRFLVALPLLIAAEIVVHQRIRQVVHRFRERKIIAESDLPKFEAAIEAAFRLRNSVLAEVVMLAFVYAVGVAVLWKNYVALHTGSWYAQPLGTGVYRLSDAGWWYVRVSLPFFQFLLLRWYFRLFIWTRFLWQVSRLKLQLVPTHPDGVGGLGFLSVSTYAFVPLATAHGALLAGNLANRILFLGEHLLAYKWEIALMVLYLLALVLGPLLLFAPVLRQVKLTGLAEYGTLAQRYVQEFDQKWLRGAPPSEPLVGSSDIQSLADLSASFEVIKGMHRAPFNRDSLVMLVGASLLPIVPLMLTMMPLEELLKKLLQILF